MELVYPIIEEVANQEGITVDSQRLPPLYETIDPKLLQRFVEMETCKTSTLEFEYYGHRVAVFGDGSIEVRETVDHPVQMP
ncbi:HalOD1 output domain-containing protein [Haloarcula nitratireducens]|uniref:Halobacterial output domain-containing protein n=1 Tax=Haloarcula nitratireducens TaxID=2487749 RepID=A0AAW4PHR4_9EURY|nr:HalOD1 output domain-containing protein [Halomicroarcula nitratireducens]MBX0296810.1 hypothetical protein [Halomicroarcula nitratireducens]